MTTSNNSIADTFNKILGKHAKERTHVSIDEDKRLLQEHYLESSTPFAIAEVDAFEYQLPQEALENAKKIENRLDKIRNAQPQPDNEPPTISQKQKERIEALTFYEKRN